MTREQIIALVARCGSEKEWNACCELVRLRFDGTYPEYWQKDIIESGLAQKVRTGWNAPENRTYH